MELSHLWKKIKRSDVTRILTLDVITTLYYRNKVLEQVGISKHPAITPIPWDEKYHIDICTIESQRPDGRKPFMVTGYEIKSCRSDFTSDKKWRNYLGRTDRFFFVAPIGVIKPSELEDGVGLIEVKLSSHEFQRRGMKRETGYSLGWNCVKGAKKQSMSDVERFDLMYALATANSRMADGYRRTLRDKKDKILREILEGYREIDFKA